MDIRYRVSIMQGVETYFTYCLDHHAERRDGRCTERERERRR